MRPRPGGNERAGCRFGGSGFAGAHRDLASERAVVGAVPLGQARAGRTVEGSRRPPFH